MSTKMKLLFMTMVVLCIISISTSIVLVNNIDTKKEIKYTYSEIGTGAEPEEFHKIEREDFAPGGFFGVFPPEVSYFPKEGFVPDAETAIKIAEAAWLPIYGKDVLDEKPYVVTYDRKYLCWYVNGTLPKDMMGGTAQITIDRMTGEILYLCHGK